MLTGCSLRKARNRSPVKRYAREKEADARPLSQLVQRRRRRGDVERERQIEGDGETH